jgi:hypothetical protein
MNPIIQGFILFGIVLAIVGGEAGFIIALLKLFDFVWKREAL